MDNTPIQTGQNVQAALQQELRTAALYRLYARAAGYITGLPHFLRIGVGIELLQLPLLLLVFRSQFLAILLKRPHFRLYVRTLIRKCRPGQHDEKKRIYYSGVHSFSFKREIWKLPPDQVF